jgi:DUF438 domain-containing protein
MSELLNNREYRQKVIKEIILELHHGKGVEEVKAKFDEVAKDLEAAELSLIEQKLINEGLPIAEVERLCDVHAAVFREALDKKPEISISKGHPADIFMEENRALKKLIDQEIKPVISELLAAAGAREQELVLLAAEKLSLLSDVDKHYRRKEDLVFPFLEKYEITGPPQVMWGVDDKNRELVKQAKTAVKSYKSNEKPIVIAAIKEALDQIEEMFFKEEKIFLPMALETLSEDEWFQVMQESDEIGYCLIEPDLSWRPSRANVTVGSKELFDEQTNEYIKFGTGVLLPKEVNLIFNHLPVDITFVDKNGVVKYFSSTKERIFPRARTIIGRKVENCHPPASVHIVEAIVEAFKNGKKEHEDFWLKMEDKYVYIRYFAVKDDEGKFAGVLEVTQDIKPIQDITGEKRIMDE